MDGVGETALLLSRYYTQIDVVCGLIIVLLCISVLIGSESLYYLYWLFIFLPVICPSLAHIPISGGWAGVAK